MTAFAQRITVGAALALSGLCHAHPPAHPPAHPHALAAIVAPALEQPVEPSIERPDEPFANDAGGARAEVEAFTRGVSPFGAEGATYWSLTMEGALSKDGSSFGPRVGVHNFLADDFEISASVAVWGHVQDGDDAVSINPSLALRWHFISEDTHSVYADIGVGMLFSTSRVPEAGTRINFTPRAGVGVTLPVGDEGARLDLGLRWHHISNASTSGTDNNPDRDGLGFYAGLIFPF